MKKPYDYKNCQSLFGYAFAVHVRSAGTCQLCGCGGASLSFDLWRQMTVEHLIGKKQGGYLREIRLAVAVHFPQLALAEQDRLSRDIDAVNTVTACSFCNSTTSQHASASSMSELIASSGGPENVVAHIRAAIEPIIEHKRREVQWKLESVRREYDSRFLTQLPPRPPAVPGSPPEPLAERGAP